MRRFRAWNGFLRSVNRASAADGSKLDREALIRSGYVARDLSYSAGTLGCAISHIKLWEIAASQALAITIFEDDIIVSPRFESEAEKILAALPADWDIIKWGYLLNPSYIWVDLGISKAKIEGYGSRVYERPEDILKFWSENNCNGAVRMLHSFGFQGYSISAKGARAALEYCLPLRNRLVTFSDTGIITQDLGIDIALAGLYPSLKAFICIPPLVMQYDEKYSDRKTIDNECKVADSGRRVGAESSVEVMNLVRPEATLVPLEQQMQWNARLVERIELVPVHGATSRVGDDGVLILTDGPSFNWHLLRWTDPRLDGTRVRLSIVAKPAEGCDTNLYVHHWGGRDVCSIDKVGTVVISDGADEVLIERRADGFYTATIVFDNHHPTLNIGMGKPGGQYHGTGTDQYHLKSIEVELLPVNPARQTMVGKLWRGSDPFRGLPGNLFEFDLQGWNSQHPYLSESIAELRPKVILEIGVWKGGSTVFMANELKKHALSSVVIAVDTWLGSSEHWMGQSNSDLSFLNGRPALYYKFLSNVIHAKVADYVVPLPIDSLNAAEILRIAGVRPELIHLDGGHDYESVMADLRVWWSVLAPGGVLIGDDYYSNGVWPTVRQAFDDFFSGLKLLPIMHSEGKCRVQKPTIQTE